MRQGRAGMSLATNGESDEDQRTQHPQRHGRRGEEGQTTSHVRLDLGGGNVVTASITNESVDDLKLQKGQSAYAIIKATSVMIGVD